MMIFKVLLFATGSYIFSFLNKLIHRGLRKPKGWDSRPICPSCGINLQPEDMVPIISYLLLGGRCRYCGEKIGIRDTLLELMGGGLALLCAWYWRETPVTALLVFLFFCVLTVAAFVDVDTMEIPDGCHTAIVMLALVSFLLPWAVPESWLIEISVGRLLEVPLDARLIGMVCISLPMLLLTLVISGSFGGGDIKLMAVCGLFLGWRLTLLSAVFALAAGGLWGIFLLLTKKKGKKDRFAFGPFLCIGLVLGIFFGEHLIL